MLKINMFKIKKLVVAKVQQVEVTIYYVYYVFFKISLFEDVDFKACLISFLSFKRIRKYGRIDDKRQAKGCELKMHSYPSDITRKQYDMTTRGF